MVRVVSSLRQDTPITTPSTKNVIGQLRYRKSDRSVSILIASISRMIARVGMIILKLGMEETPVEHL